MLKKLKKFKKIYLYAVSRSIAEKVIERLDLNAEITRNLDDANIVIAHKNFIKGGAKVLSTAEENRLQIFYVKTNSMAQIQKVIKEALDIAEVNERQTFYDITEKALDEDCKLCPKFTRTFMILGKKWNGLIIEVLLKNGNMRF